MKEVGNYYKVVYQVSSYYNQVFEKKEFDTHELALQYIEDMLKYHKQNFIITKMYVQNEGESE